jgi:hypothetical protein
MPHPSFEQAPSAIGMSPSKAVFSGSLSDKLGFSGVHFGTEFSPLVGGWTKVGL